MSILGMLPFPLFYIRKTRDPTPITTVCEIWQLWKNFPQKEETNLELSRPIVVGKMKFKHLPSLKLTANAPENQRLKDEFPLGGMAYFQRLYMLVSGGVFFFGPKWLNKLKVKAAF